jgi:hypothetical protein
MAHRGLDLAGLAAVLELRVETTAEAMSRVKREPGRTVLARLRKFVAADGKPASTPDGGQASESQAVQLAVRLRARVRVAHLTRRSIAQAAGVGEDVLDDALNGIEVVPAAAARLAAWAAGAANGGAAD